MSSLLVDWCSYEAAKFAVMNWHYSKTMPFGKMAKIGAWEDEIYKGCVVFSYGATPNIGSPYGLDQFEVCELTRVALNKHKNKVSEILSRSISMLKAQSPGLRLIVSFADMEQEHYGIIYQASNWIYAGTTKPGRVGFIIRGKKKHTRSIGQMGGVQSLEWVKNNLDMNATEWNGLIKHRYLYPLDRAMRRQILPLAQPYPKKEHAGEVSTVTRRNQPEIAGSSPAARSEMTGQEPVLVR